MANAQSSAIPRPAKIYLAGKITTDPWRESLVVGLRDWESHYPDHDKIGEDWPTLYGAVGGHDYVGPFAMYSSKDEFGYDESNQHGCLADASYAEGSHVWGREFSPRGDAREPFDWPREIVRRCRVAIESADVVFGWLNDTTALGTFTELGYAFGARKTVLLGFPKSSYGHNDFWFVQHLSTWSSWPGHPIAHADTPGDALWSMLKKNDTRPSYYDYIASIAWREKASAAKDRANHRCQVCNRSSVQLDAHHRTYERLGHELATDITVLCRPCHELFETTRKAQRGV